MSTPDPRQIIAMWFLSDYRADYLMGCLNSGTQPDPAWAPHVGHIAQAEANAENIEGRLTDAGYRLCAPGEANIDGTVRPADDLDALRDTLDAIHLAVTISSRDWSIHHRDAWLYGVVAGWDDEHPDDDAMPEVAERHGWDAEMVATIRFHHAAFTAARLAEGPSDGRFDGTYLGLGGGGQVHDAPLGALHPDRPSACWYENSGRTIAPPVPMEDTP